MHTSVNSPMSSALRLPRQQKAALFLTGYPLGSQVHSHYPRATN